MIIFSRWKRLKGDVKTSIIAELSKAYIENKILIMRRMCRVQRYP